MFGKKELERSDLMAATSVARNLEYSDNAKLASKTYESLSKIFAKSSNPQFRQYGKMFAGSARRLNLVGNAMELKGTRFEGEPFDLSSLEGKVVLVDFWATWCGPCLAEYPNILKNYEKYHDSGFEVVGVSIDQNRDSLDKYLKKKDVPWITLHEKDSSGRNPALEYYGISGIPSMFLIGRDGKVISVRARGQELDALLANEFGDSDADS